MFNVNPMLSDKNIQTKCHNKQTLFSFTLVWTKAEEGYVSTHLIDT